MKEKPLIQLNGPGLKKLREDQYKKQKGICPILKQEIPFSECVMDHKHKFSYQEYGEDDAGLCRGIIHNGANAVEGKIENAFKRTGLNKLISVPEYLRNLADYLESWPLEPIYIHPMDKPKEPLLTKSSYNELVRGVMKDGKYKMPEYPKSKKLTKRLAELFEQYGIEPKYYK